VKSSTATATTATGSTGYVGRFAPTPSGDLHLGSLYAAAASYLDARAHQGRWLVRIEDLDKPREIPGSADSILRTLEEFGFEWDGAVTRQSERLPGYEAALRDLDERGLIFACACSRKNLEDENRYTGTCRNLHLENASMLAARVRIEPDVVVFNDRIQGMFRQDVAAAVGDVIVKRRDQIFAYLLAVVVDDAAQGVTHVVRGADLLDNTPRQIHLQRLLAKKQPAYAHVPVLTERSDAKLSKSRRSVRVHGAQALAQILSVFSLLGLPGTQELVDAQLHEAWDWGARHWRIMNVPKCLNLHVVAS
jgi:glutamyl-Q tRNA(Asp) synthetase